MDSNDILRMAREAGLDAVKLSPALYEMQVDVWMRFAALVAAAEREACAIAAEAVVPRHTECGNRIAAAIRARGILNETGEK